MVRRRTTVAFVGTELASITSPTGGLERTVQWWARGLLDQGYDVVLVDRRPREAGALANGLEVDVLDGSADDLGPLLTSASVDVVVVNNRPLTAVGGLPRVDLLHNFPVGWDRTGRIDHEALASALTTSVPAAVSAALANAVERTFGLDRGHVATAPPPIDPVFAGRTHVGGGGILFPNRLMAKKGVRETLAALEVAGLAGRATFLDYTTPFLRTSPEFIELRGLVEASPAALGPALDASSLRDAYAAADLVVAVATEPEGLGLVPLEAQAVGAPLVTAGPGGLAEATFTPNLHLPDVDVDRLAEAIVATLGRADPGPRAQVLARYGLVPATVAIERLLIRALGGGAP